MSRVGTAATAQLAANLRALRQRSGLTQEALAHAADLHPNAVGLLERGEPYRSLGPLRFKEPKRKLIRLLDRNPQARVLRATLSRRGDRFVLSFCVPRSPKQRRPRQPSAVVGVDLGLKKLATLSTGRTWVSCRPLQASQGRLRVLERKLDRQRGANNPGNYHPDGRARKGARNWVTSGRQAETERFIRRLHARVADQRREQAHLLTTHLTLEYGVIGVETLNVKGLMANRRLARHIADVGWGALLSQLAYKAKWASSLLIPAGRFTRPRRPARAEGQ